MIKHGILGQAAPAAATLVAVYRCPDREAAREVRVICTNRGADATVRIAAAPNGAADAVEHYVAYNTALPEGGTVSSVELTLGGGTLLRVWSDSGDVSFSVIGTQFTV